eukprot:tig00020531_g10041.t1
MQYWLASHGGQIRSSRHLRTLAACSRIVSSSFGVELAESRPIPSPRSAVLPRSAAEPQLPAVKARGSRGTVRERDASDACAAPEPLSDLWSIDLVTLMHM